MSTMTAIYENGVFRPLGPVRLPEHTEQPALPVSYVRELAGQPFHVPAEPGPVR